MARDSITASQRRHQLVASVGYLQNQPKKRKHRRRRLRPQYDFSSVWWEKYFSSSLFFSITLMIICGMVLLFLLYSWFSSSSATIAGVSKKKTLSSSECPPYGCPSYPLNYDDESVKTYIQTIQNFVRAKGLRGVYNEGVDVVTMTRQTNEEHPNQDRAVVIKPFIASTTEEDNSDDFLAAIFDGHGPNGHVVAEYAQKKLPLVLSQKLGQVFYDNTDSGGDGDAGGLNKEEQIKHALIETFVQIDQTAPSDVALDSGCTGSLVLKLNQTLYVANTGDSRSFISTVVVETSTTKTNSNDQIFGNNVKVPYITRQDKPHLPEEKKRIEQEGGKIHTPKPPKSPYFSRVVAYSPTLKENVALAMSRSIGDAVWTKVGVIPDPIVDVLHVNDLIKEEGKKKNNKAYFFAVVGSDGLFDSRNKEFVAKYFAESFYNKGEHPVVMGYNLIQLASPAKEEWYRDDMTFSVVKFRL